MSEAKKRFPGFIGPMNESRAQRFDAQRTINLVLEMNALGQGKGLEPAVLLDTPGLKFLQTIGTGPIRALYTVSALQVAIVVSGNEVYQLSAAIGLPIAIVGNLTTTHGPVSVADNGIQCVLVDGANGYYFTIGEFALHTIDDPNFYPADIVSFQDGYFILNRKGTGDFFWSDLYSIDFPALNTARKAGNSDMLTAAFSNNREIYLLGVNTTEAWYNSGASGNTPFSRQDGRFSQVGCASPASIARIGETFMFLGTNQQGGGVVYSLENAMPSRISTNAVEVQLQKYLTLNLATAYAYQQEGHLFYVLNIPTSNTTFVYDVSTKLWAERQSTTNDGRTGRHLGEVHCTLWNEHLIGDYRNGNLYKLDMQCYTDNGETKLKLRQAPHVSEEMNELFLRLFELDCQFGTGLTDNGDNPASNVAPRIALEISRDGGKTFGPAMLADIGRIGVYRTRARWQRLGRGRDLVFRVSTTDSVSVAFLSAHLDLEVGRG